MPVMGGEELDQAGRSVSLPVSEIGEGRVGDYRATIGMDADHGSVVDPVGFSLGHHLAGSAHVEMSKPTGGHFLHAAVGMCIFNDTLSLANERAIVIDALRVDVDGGFAGEEYYVSTGITFDIAIESPASRDEIAALIAAVIDDASIPRSIQQGTPVRLGELTVN